MCHHQHHTRAWNPVLQALQPALDASEKIRDSALALRRPPHQHVDCSSQEKELVRLEVHCLPCKVKQGKIDILALWCPLGDVYANRSVVCADVEGRATLRREAHDDAGLPGLPVAYEKERHARVDLPCALHLPQKPHGGLSALAADLLGDGPQL